jgi:hypothetical protein
MNAAVSQGHAGVDVTDEVLVAVQIGLYSERLIM